MKSTLTMSLTVCIGGLMFASAASAGPKLVRKTFKRPAGLKRVRIPGKLHFIPPALKGRVYLYPRSGNPASGGKLIVTVAERAPFKPGGGLGQPQWEDHRHKDNPHRQERQGALGVYLPPLAGGEEPPPVRVE